MTDYHHHRIVPDGQNPVADQNRNTDSYVFSHQIPGPHKQMFQPETNSLVNKKQIPADNTRLKYSGNQCPQRRARDSKPGHSQLAENKSIIGHKINAKGTDRYIQRHPHLPYAPQHNRTDQRHPQKEIGDNRITEIDHSKRNNRAFRRIHFHHCAGNDQRNHSK